MESDYYIEKLKQVNSKDASEISLLMKQHLPDAPEITVDYIKKVISNQLLSVFVARNRKKRIVGMITIVSFLNLEGLLKTWLEDLIVDVSYRRKGIGKALIKKALDKAKNLKIKTLHLTSRPSRVAANLLYKKFGFKLYETNYYKYEL